MSAPRKTPSLLFPALFTLLALAVLCGLGVWQLKRLEWKTDLLDKLEAEYARGERDSVFEPKELNDTFQFRRRTVPGTYNYAAQILVGPKVYGNLPGNHVYTPLKLDDGSWILVNRGWVPQHWTSSDEISPPAGRVMVLGLLRLPERNPFTPDNVPYKDQWYYPDAQQIAEAKNLRPLHDYILFAEGDGNMTDYPLAIDSRPQLRNDHLQYAIFWFTMAGALVIIFILRFLRK